MAVDYIEMQRQYLLKVVQEAIQTGAKILNIDLNDEAVSRVKFYLHYKLLEKIKTTSPMEISLEGISFVDPFSLLVHKNFINKYSAILEEVF